LYSQQWTNVDSSFGPLPGSVHIYFTREAIDTAPFRAYYLIADLRDKKLDFTVDTTLNRRQTPKTFYNNDDHPLVVVNASFFSYETNRNQNVIIKDGEMVGFNIHTINGRGKDTFTYRHPFGSAIGISKKRKADVAWLFTDSAMKYPYASQQVLTLEKDSIEHPTFEYINQKTTVADASHNPNLQPRFKRWKMRTAIGGGPVLLQHGEINITNNEELKFTGKAIHDKHPRTAMGYTGDGKLIILMVEGRNTVAHGAMLEQEAKILKDLGCVEAINLDGGGSSCMLINGNETIKISDKDGERPVPAVFIIRSKH
jgi:hypothetical protein